MKINTRFFVKHTVILLLAIAPLHAETIVPRGSVSGIWNAEGSPYIVTGDIAVSSSLTVEEGVVIRFQGSTGLTVPDDTAVLRILGTADFPVILTADSTTPSPGFWNGLDVRNSNQSNYVCHATIEYAEKGVSCQGVSARVGRIIAEHVVIRWCSGDGLLAEGIGGTLLNTDDGKANITLRHCQMHQNGGHGVQLAAASPWAEGWVNALVVNCIFTGNMASGIKLWGDGRLISGIQNCVVYGNENSGIETSGTFSQLGSVRFVNNIIASNSRGITCQHDGPINSVYNNVWNNGTNWVGFPADFDPATNHNISVDPLFADADAGDFHLQSQAGRHNPATGTWVQDGVSSPCIDAGDPVLAWANEPQPNGWRVNMGAYGDTPFASKSMRLTVSTLADSGPGSLRQAIADAAPGGTIDFEVTGTITLTSGELVATNDLNIAGPGPANLTVSGNNVSRVVRVSGGIVSISGLAITGGKTGFGNDGGGVYNSASLTISNCALIGNRTDASGGGVFNEGNLWVQYTSVSDNVAQFDGGGIGSYGPLVLLDSTINSNGAEFYGGGCFFRWSTFSMTNVTISGNNLGHSGASGGGVWCRDGVGSITSCTIAANDQGGVCNLIDNPLSIRNTVIAGNFFRSDYEGNLNSLDYNLIGNTNGATITGVTTHNICGKDPLLGPLADNGGPTPTHALLPGSPAIDHGSSGGLATDQRGLPRPFDFPLYYDADDGADIGAVEMHEGPQAGSVFTVNTTDDLDDGVPGIAHCSLREAIAAANSNSDSNTIDFAAEVPGVHADVTGTIVLTNGQLTIGAEDAYLHGGYHVNLSGPRASKLTISGNNATRVFSKRFATTWISGLTIADGAAIAPWAGGAGIENAGGTLYVSDCVISNCVAQAGGGVDSYGVYASGASVNLSRCLITANQSLLGVGGGVDGSEYIWVTDSTISSNAGGAIRVSGFTGGIYRSTISGNAGYGMYRGTSAAGGYRFEVVSSTICSNTGPGIQHQDWPRYPVFFKSTILSGNAGGSGPECVGGVQSEDYNLIQNTNGFPITGTSLHNIYNQDPKLGPLSQLGGFAPTHALRFDSPAIDAGFSEGAIADQRGFARVIDDPGIANAEGGDGSDIGAFEADSNLRLTGIKKTGDNINLTFSSMLGRDYRIEWASDLTGPWNVLTDSVPGTGSFVQALDAGGATEPRRFYRAKLVTE